MTGEELERRIKAKQAPIILDVRSGFEFRSGHLPGAVHAPLVKVLQATAAVLHNKTDLIVVTCEHGPRAQLARMLLTWRGYKNIELLEGHMAHWRHSGRSVKKNK
jgi:hydroxyacylglutathione hydrolase